MYVRFRFRFAPSACRPGFSLHALEIYDVINLEVLGIADASWAAMSEAGRAAVAKEWALSKLEVGWEPVVGPPREEGDVW